VPQFRRLLVRRAGCRRG